MRVMLLHVVADFGTGDLAFAEVAQRFALLFPDATVVSTAVPPFATLVAGFVTAQLALNDGPDNRVVFQNVAPRRDDDQARRDNDGERLLHAVLPSGVQVVGVDAGYAFSFLAEAGASFRVIDVATRGSQFRSRDLFPEAMAAALRGERLADAVDPASLPSVPNQRLAYVDGFGNLKTTLTQEALPEPGSICSVTLGGVTQEVMVADGVFAVPHGSLVLAPGSSGWTMPDGSRRRWVEVLLRGGSAHAAFGHPAVETELVLS